MNRNRCQHQKDKKFMRKTGKASYLRCPKDGGVEELEEHAYIRGVPETPATFCLMYLLARLGSSATPTSSLSMLSGNPNHRQGAIHSSGGP
jgi:hypothetical protein